MAADGLLHSQHLAQCRHLANVPHSPAVSGCRNHAPPSAPDPCRDKKGQGLGGGGRGGWASTRPCPAARTVMKCLGSSCLCGQLSLLSPKEAPWQGGSYTSLLHPNVSPPLRPEVPAAAMQADPDKRCRVRPLLTSRWPWNGWPGKIGGRCGGGGVLCINPPDSPAVGVSIRSLLPSLSPLSSSGRSGALMSGEEREGTNGRKQTEAAAVTQPRGFRPPLPRHLLQGEKRERGRACSFDHVSVFLPPR